MGERVFSRRRCREGAGRCYEEFGVLRGFWTGETRVKNGWSDGACVSDILAELGPDLGSTIQEYSADSCVECVECVVQMVGQVQQVQAVRVVWEKVVTFGFVKGWADVREINGAPQAPT